MNKIGFDNKKYLSLQSEKIEERINSFGGKLYLEFGGKLFDDFHASRVLPGFEPDSKIKMLLKLKDIAEILVVISANDIENNRYRSDLGITYDADVLRLLDIFKAQGLYVGSVVMTMYHPQPAVDAFIKRLNLLTAMKPPKCLLDIRYKPLRFKGALSNDLRKIKESVLAFVGGEVVPEPKTEK